MEVGREGGRERRREAGKEGVHIITIISCKKKDEHCLLNDNFNELVTYVSLASCIGNL